jgi:HAD superfamily hydrolase (TIGR01549 family)
MSGPGRIEAVVFDLDGTLADTMALAPQAYADTIRCLGGPKVTPAEVVAAWNTGSTPVVLEHFLGRAVASRDVDCFYANFEALIPAVQSFPGIPGMLRSLRRQGYRLGIFTHATRRAANLTIAAAGLDRFRFALVGGEEIAELKPAPDGLLLTCRRLKVAPSSVAYIGDAETDLQCAAAAGSLGIHARWGAVTPGLNQPCLAAGQPADIPRLLVRIRPPDSGTASIEHPA